ncbi:MAG TPA: hypothetical protein VH437_17410 [Terriglobales bacterium]
MKAEPFHGEVPVPSGTWSYEETTLQKPKCLRCNTELRDYRLLRFNFLPYGLSRQNAMLVCASCGHIEFVTKDSALLKNLNAMPSAGGDDD